MFQFNRMCYKIASVYCFCFWRIDFFACRESSCSCPPPKKKNKHAISEKWSEKFGGKKRIAAIKAGCDELFKKNLNMSLNGAQKHKVRTPSAFDVSGTTMCTRHVLNGAILPRIKATSSGLKYKLRRCSSAILYCGCKISINLSKRFITCLDF